MYMLYYFLDRRGLHVQQSEHAEKPQKERKMNAMEKREDLANAFLNKLSESEKTILATLQEVDMWQGRSDGKTVPDSLKYITKAVKGDAQEFRCGFLGKLGGYLETNENATFAEAYEYLMKDLGRIEWKSGKTVVYHCREERKKVHCILRW